MNIIYEHDDIFDVYQLSASKTISKKRFFTGLSDVLNGLSGDLSHAMILLDESRFDFYSCKIECTSRHPFTISELKSLVAQKLHWMRRQEDIHTEYSKHIVDNCHVDGKPVDYCIGQTGNISFNLNFFCLKKEDCLQCKKTVGSTFLDNKKYTIMPKSLYLITYLTKALRKRDFAFVTINEKTCQFISVQQGFYSRFESVNMGESLVQACYKEHDIQQYLYEGYDRIEKNDLLKKLVNESLSFYAMQMCNRVQQFVVEGYELLLMSNMITNPLFIPALQQHYHNNKRGFIVPLHTLFTQSDFVYEYAPNEIPVMAAYLLHS